MTSRLTALCVRVTALALTVGFCAQVTANTYRYTDQNGQIIISSTIPPEATQRGYDILNSKGRVIESILPALTEADIAVREAEKKQQQALAEQRKKDRMLLKRFSHPDEVVQAMHRKIRELESLARLKRGSISVISSQLTNEQSRAADMEQAGSQIPDAVLEKIRRLESRIQRIEG